MTGACEWAKKMREVAAMTEEESEQDQGETIGDIMRKARMAREAHEKQEETDSIPLPFPQVRQRSNYHIHRSDAFKSSAHCTHVDASIHRVDLFPLPNSLQR